MPHTMYVNMHGSYLSKVPSQPHYMFWSENGELVARSRGASSKFWVGALCWAVLEVACMTYNGSNVITSFYKLTT